MHIPRGTITVAVAVIALALSGCGGDEPEPASPTPSTSATAGSGSTSAAETTTSPTGPPDATAVAERVKAGVESVTKIVTITEDNDPNDKIGRPGGYVSAATLYDQGGSCTELGADCGATVEVWPDEESARARSDFIQDALKDANGVLGEEYHYQDGPALLRVTGAIKPSVAKQYEAAFAQK